MMEYKLVILLSLFCVTGQSQEVRRFFTGSRMMGMGGASIAVVNDETALLSNPAGLGKLRDKYGTILDPEVDLSSNYFKSGASSVKDPLNLETVKPILDASLDTYYHARAQLFPSFVVRNFGMGIFYRRVLDAYEDPTGTNVTANYYDDMALVLGYNFRFFDGRVKFGFNAKFISRIAIENSTLASTAAMDLKSNAVEGAGIGSDVGMILTAPWTWLPTISAVVRDAGGTSFNSGSGLRLAVANRPAKVEQDIDVAVALFPIHANRIRSSFTLEYSKITAASKDADKTRYMHAGLETNFSDILFVRAGMNQRYWTGGLELASEHTQVQLTTYGEDVGATGSPVEDRRYMFKFSFRF